MTVRSEELKSPPRQETKQEITGAAVGGGQYLIGALAFAFGVPFWWLGAKYSLDGWIIALNVLCEILTLPFRIPLASGWWVLLAVPLGLSYSYVELKVRPKWRGKVGGIVALVLLTLLAHGTDIGSTIVAAMQPAANAWPLTKWAALAVWPAVAWGLVLTYFPELLILLGIRSFRR